MRTLFLSYMHPWPPTRGAAQRTNLIHRCLAEHGEVDMLLLLDEADFTPEWLQTLRDDWGLVKCVPTLARAEHGLWKWLRPLNPSLSERLAHNLGSKAVAYGTDPRVHEALNESLAKRSYDLVVGRFLMSVTKAGVLGKLPVVLDVDAADTEIYRSRLNAADTSPVVRAILWHHLRQLEKIVPEKLDACAGLWVANDADRLRRGLERARYLPNIPFAPEGAPRPSLLPDNRSSRAILLVGTMSWAPNVEAADYFVRNVFPQVRSTVSDAEFHIVGTGVSDDMRSRWAAVPGVRVIGFVEDITAAYASCAFTVVPIFSGAGTNVKLVDSLANGRTCVVSPYGHRGYETDLLHMESLYLATDAAAMARGCIELLLKPEMRAAFAQHGARIVAEKYSFDAFREVIAETISNVMAAPKAFSNSPAPLMIA
jgi:hypothetical protein